MPPQRIHVVRTVGAGIGCLLPAPLMQLTAVASGNYKALLITALTLATAGCFLSTFRSGGNVTRILSVVLLLPSLFIFWDFSRLMG